MKKDFLWRIFILCGKHIQDAALQKNKIKMFNEIKMYIKDFMFLPVCKFGLVLGEKLLQEKKSLKVWYFFLNFNESYKIVRFVKIIYFFI